MHDIPPSFIRYLRGDFVFKGWVSVLSATRPQHLHKPRGCRVRPGPMPQSFLQWWVHCLAQNKGSMNIWWITEWMWERNEVTWQWKAYRNFPICQMRGIVPKSWILCFLPLGVKIIRVHKVMLGSSWSKAWQTRSLCVSASGWRDLPHFQGARYLGFGNVPSQSPGNLHNWDELWFQLKMKTQS